MLMYKLLLQGLIEVVGQLLETAIIVLEPLLIVKIQLNKRKECVGVKKNCSKVKGKLNI